MCSTLSRSSSTGLPIKSTGASVNGFFIYLGLIAKCKTLIEDRTRY